MDMAGKRKDIMGMGLISKRIPASGESAIKLPMVSSVRNGSLVSLSCSTLGSRPSKMLSLILIVRLYLSTVDN